MEGSGVATATGHTLVTQSAYISLTCEKEGNELANEITLGAAVLTADAKQLGTVKKVEGGALLLNAPRQSDYWLEVTLVASADATKVQLSINEADLGGYKMDRPHDPNGFHERHAANLDPSNVRGESLRNR